MAENEHTSPRTRRRARWWLKAVVFAISLTVILSVYLGLTGYPPEEWPFVAGVFGPMLLLSNLAVAVALLLAAKGLNQYRKVALNSGGVDVEALDAKVASGKAVKALVKVVIVLMYVGLVWGMALNVSMWLLGFWGLPEFNPKLHFAAVVMLAAGGGGILCAISLSFACYWLIEKLGGRGVPAVVVLRTVLMLVSRFQERAETGIGSGTAGRVKLG